MWPIPNGTVSGLFLFLGYVVFCCDNIDCSFGVMISFWSWWFCTFWFCLLIEHLGAQSGSMVYPQCRPVIKCTFSLPQTFGLCEGYPLQFFIIDYILFFIFYQCQFLNYFWGSFFCFFDVQSTPTHKKRVSGTNIITLSSYIGFYSEQCSYLTNSYTLTTLFGDTVTLFHNGLHLSIAV